MRFGQAAAFVALWRIGPWVKPYVSAATRSKGDHDDLITNNEELRIVMVGKTGAGKSATGNTILGFKAFESKFRSKSVTANCLKVRGVAGRNAVPVAVIDTPGLFDTTYSRKETIQEILQCLSFASPGPHVFLIVIKLDRFTKEEQRSVQLIQQMFGQSSHAYSMILFTNGDRVVDETVEEMLKDDPVLRGIVDTCNGRYHVFNNNIKDPSQVNELLGKIDKIKQINGGSHYTTEMFQTAERALGLVKQIILREREEEIQKDMAELEKKHERNMQDIDEMIKKQQEKAERVARMNEEKRRHKEMEEIKNKYESMRVALAAKEDEETRRKEAEEELKRQYEREAQEKEEKLKKEQQEEQERIVREMEETKCKELEEQKKAHEREMKEMQDRYEREARGTAELHTFTIIGRFIGKHIAGEPGSKVGAAVGKVLADVTSLTGSCSIQ